MVAPRTASPDGREKGSGSPAIPAAATAAAHERLYQAAEKVRARRAQEVAAKERAETVGCTFHPVVNHGAFAADSALR